MRVLNNSWKVLHTLLNLIAGQPQWWTYFLSLIFYELFFIPSERMI